MLVEHSIPNLPAFGELNDHLKPVDWLLSNFAFRHWRIMHAAIHPPDATEGSATLEVRQGSVSNSRTLVRGAVATIPPQKDLNTASATASLVAPAAAWTIANWQGAEHPLPAAAGTSSWESWAAFLSGAEHLHAGSYDHAIVSFTLALDRDTKNQLAETQLLTAARLQYPTNTQISEAVAERLEDLYPVASASDSQPGPG